MKILYIIPARGGSKGIPRKNIKLLAGKPLIYYSIDVAREITSDINICVSTDDEEIIKIVEDYGLKIPFKRPDELSSDTASTNDVLLHAVNFYEQHNIFYDLIVLLQPTSPLRTSTHIKEAIALYEEQIDMVVSVKESHCQTVLCKENKYGFIELIFNKEGIRRQESKPLYEYNGAIYVIGVPQLKSKRINEFQCIRKYVMDEEFSIDIDNFYDWDYCEIILQKRK